MSLNPAYAYIDWHKSWVPLTPFHYRLAAVNFFLGCVGLVQVTRIFMWQRSQEGSSLDAAKEIEHQAVDSVKAVAAEAENAVKSVGKKSS